MLKEFASIIIFPPVISADLLYTNIPISIKTPTYRYPAPWVKTGLEGLILENAIDSDDLGWMTIGTLYQMCDLRQHS